MVIKVLVSPGSVVRPGEPMTGIIGKHRFVVAWFPVSRLFALAETAPALASISPPDSGLPPESEWSAKPYPADALPFGMQYCLRRLREP